MREEWAVIAVAEGGLASKLENARLSLLSALLARGENGQQLHHFVLALLHLCVRVRADNACA